MLLPVFATFGCLNCNFVFVFGKLWCSKARMSHNEVHCRTGFSHLFCLPVGLSTCFVFPPNLLVTRPVNLGTNLGPSPHRYGGSDVYPLPRVILMQTHTHLLFTTLICTFYCVANSISKKLYAFLLYCSLTQGQIEV